MNNLHKFLKVINHPLFGKFNKKKAPITVSCHENNRTSLILIQGEDLSLTI